MTQQGSLCAMCVSSWLQLKMHFLDNMGSGESENGMFDRNEMIFWQVRYRS
jgi:hypothetical protein